MWVLGEILRPKERTEKDFFFFSFDFFYLRVLYDVSIEYWIQFDLKY